MSCPTTDAAAVLIPTRGGHRPVYQQCCRRQCSGRPVGRRGWDAMGERRERLSGPDARLVVDTLLPVHELVDYLPAAYVADHIKAGAVDALDWVYSEPWWHALQASNAVLADTDAECRLCAPVPDPLLSVVQCSRSGSMAEGFHDLEFGVGGTSDYDNMFELDGAFGWAAEPVQRAGSEPARISPGSAPQLWAESTGSPGFVQLRWVRTSQCSHAEPLPALAPDSVRRLMREYGCLVATKDTRETSYAGPAVNIRPLQATLESGGVDHVPCLALPWWPDKQAFLDRRRTTDFPPAIVRRDICQYGVHLVPTGRPGSDTELAEWRVSFSRAEVVTAYHMSAQHRAVVKAVKRLKIRLKEKGAEPALKSYHIKTAVSWLVQDEPSERWLSVTDAVQMVLDWLERHFIAGRMPCFFWAEIDLLSGLGREKVDAMARTVRLMRSSAAQLLLATCIDRYPFLERSLQEARPGQLGQLRPLLARLLIHEAVVLGVTFRPSAPCWQFWNRYFIPPLLRLSEVRLLDWRHRRDSAAYHQQCMLLQALLVALDDLAGGGRMTSPGHGVLVWDVAPLMALLTESDLQLLLGDPAAVAAWCRQQLRRPLAGRPAGLTAELDTPRGRAELLLRPELLLRAVSEAAPSKAAAYSIHDEHLVTLWRQEYNTDEVPNYQVYRKKLESGQKITSTKTSEVIYREMAALDVDRSVSKVAVTVHLLNGHERYLLSGDRLRRKYDAAGIRHADRWRLRQFVVTDGPTTDGSPRGDGRGAPGDEQKRIAQWEQQRQEEERFHLWAQERCRAYLAEWQEMRQLLQLLLRQCDEQERAELIERNVGEQDELASRHLRALMQHFEWDPPSEQA